MKHGQREILKVINYLVYLSAPVYFLLNKIHSKTDTMNSNRDRGQHSLQSYIGEYPSGIFC